jgi:hypothetical protein
MPRPDACRWQHSGEIYMTGNARTSDADKTPKLDPLTLWLNYENKMEELRTSFLTIAGLFFTVQSGIFVVMVDKIFLSEKETLLLLFPGIMLILLSILVFIFFSTVSSLYQQHIKNNEHRSKFVTDTYDRNKYIQEFSASVTVYLKKQSPHYKTQESDRVIKQVRNIYNVLFGATLVVFGLCLIGELSKG